MSKFIIGVLGLLCIGLAFDVLVFSAEYFKLEDTAESFITLLAIISVIAVAIALGIKFMIVAGWVQKVSD